MLRLTDFSGFRSRDPSARDRAVDGHGADVDGHAGDEVGRRRGKELLVERWRAEPVRNRAAQREAVTHFITQRELAVDRAAEIRESLVPARERRGQAGEQFGVELDIAREAVAAGIGGAGGREARKSLRSRARLPPREAAGAKAGRGRNIGEHAALGNASALITSTGTGLSASVRSVRRVPVTMISSPASTSGWFAGAAACAAAAEPGCSCATAGVVAAKVPRESVARSVWRSAVAMSLSPRPASSPRTLRLRLYAATHKRDSLQCYSFAKACCGSATCVPVDTPLRLT